MVAPPTVDEVQYQNQSLARAANACLSTAGVSRRGSMIVSSYFARKSPIAGTAEVP
jgi:hypothetical protein